MKVLPIVTSNNSSATNVSETEVVEGSAESSDRKKREVEGSGEEETPASNNALNSGEKSITIVDESECDESNRYLLQQFHPIFL